MLTFLRSERPISADLAAGRLRATSIACCMRWTFEAKEAMSTRPSSRGMIVAERLAHRPLGRRHARSLGVRRVAEEQVDAAVADAPRAGRRRCGTRRPGCGRSCSRRCGRCGRRACRARPRRRPGSSARRARTRAVKGPIRTGAALRVGLDQLRGAQQAVLVELRLDEPEREAGRPHLGDVELAQEVRERADVILVAVREDDRADLVAPIARGRRSRAAADRRRDARPAGTRARRRRRRCRRRTRRRSCSCRPRRGRRAG